MQTKLARQIFSIISAAAILGFCVMSTSCEKKPKTLGDKIKDGLDVRPNEKLKDAGEDIKDAAKDAADAVKVKTK